jgi:hypothetical protein
VTVRLYNSFGSEVISNSAGTQSPGKQSLKLDIATLPAGVYILKLERGTEVRSEKIVVLK